MTTGASAPADGGSPFRLTPEGATFVEGSERPVAEAFADSAAMLFHNVVDQAFWDFLEARITAPMVRQNLPDFDGGRWVERAPQLASTLLMDLIRRPATLQWFSKVWGGGDLADAEGEIAEHRAGGDDYLPWHDDGHQRSRRLALVVNLSTVPFVGGEFEMRKRRTGQTVICHQNSEPGSALLFRVAPRFEHRVLPITAGGPRRVFAGSFRVAE